MHVTLNNVLLATIFILFIGRHAKAEGTNPGSQFRGVDLYGDPLPSGAIARLGTQRLRAGIFSVDHIAFSPKGNIIASTADGREVQIWDVGSGKELVLTRTHFLAEDKHPEHRGWAKMQRRDALELSCKSRFEKQPMWATLLDRIPCHQWADDLDLKLAEAESIAYEDMLRETSKTNEDDARHRSSALAVRARALYLRGHFRQAHHYLDLASAGLDPERLDHRTAISVIHLLRAELLGLSASHHYEEDPCRAQDPHSKIEEFSRGMRLAAAASLKKIERAEKELQRAEEALRGMAHQNSWLLSLEFGWAQIKLERMLFEIEALFWSWDTLILTEYLQMSGAFEKLILDGMRRLRNSLDIIPYRSKRWPKHHDWGLAASIVDTECMIYKLWRQYFVAGAFYSALLSNRRQNLIHLERKTVRDITQQIIPCLTGLAVTGEDASHYRERWKLWCTAMRFEHFGNEVKLVKSLRPGQLRAQDSLQRPSQKRPEPMSLRSAIIPAMLEECSKEEITEMWNIRRDKPKRLEP